MEKLERYQNALENIEHYAVNNEFSKIYSEKYLCPNCRNKELNVDWKSINVWHTRKSQQYMDECRHKSIWWDEEIDSELQFIGRLICDCGEIIAISGDAEYEHEIADDNGDEVQYLDEKYRIKYFSRAIQTFFAPDNTPPKYAQILEEAFQLFYLNPSASGNRLRVLLEFIVDDLLGSEAQGIPNLNRKIGKLTSILPDVQRLADLNRILGNRASHKNGLNYNDLTTAFYFMDQLLNRAYGEQYEMLRLYTHTELKGKNSGK